MSVQLAKKNFDSCGLHPVSCVDHYIYHQDTNSVPRSCVSALGLHIFSSLQMDIMRSALESHYYLCQTSSVQCNCQLGSSSYQVPKIRYHVAWEDLCQTEHIDHVIHPEEQDTNLTSSRSIDVTNNSCLSQDAPREQRFVSQVSQLLQNEFVKRLLIC